MKSIEGKVAIVTGAARGIGLATAKKLSDAGARVVINDLDEAEAINAGEQIKGAEVFCADLTERDSGDRLIDFALDRLGGVDILVNNAGYIWHSAIHNMTDEQWDAMLDIHVSAQFRILRAYGRWLRANTDRNSHIRKVVNISSTMGCMVEQPWLTRLAKRQWRGLLKHLGKRMGFFNVTVKTGFLVILLTLQPIRN